MAQDGREEVFRRGRSSVRKRKGGCEMERALAVGRSGRSASEGVTFED